MSRTTKASAVAILIGIFALPLLAQSSSSTAPLDGSSAYYLLHHPRALAKFLDMSGDQTKQLLGFWKTLQTTLQPLYAARDPLCEQLRTDLAAQPPSPPAVGDDTIALFDNKQQVRDAWVAYNTSVEGILNPAQVISYETLEDLASGTDPDFNVIGNCPAPKA
ncbi:MAG TPA: hypothetical protein VHQ90_14795 [Thermoanaerobaculia bacterium]|nr:hypothetical protein [Thermoanaerobaculia bacterium]